MFRHYSKYLSMFVLCFVGVAAWADDYITPTCVNANPLPSGQQNMLSSPAANGGMNAGSTGRCKKGCDGTGKSTGDPLEIGKGTFFQDVVDASIPVKHGLELPVRRVFSNNWVQDLQTYSVDKHTLSFSDNFNWHFFLYEAQIVGPQGDLKDNIPDQKYKMGMRLWQERAPLTDRGQVSSFGGMNVRVLTSQWMGLGGFDHSNCSVNFAKLWDDTYNEEIDDAQMEEHILYFLDEKGNITHFDMTGNAVPGLGTFKVTPNNFPPPVRDSFYRLQNPTETWKDSLWISEFKPMTRTFQGTHTVVDRLYPLLTRQTTDDVTLYVIYNYSNFVPEHGPEQGATRCFEKGWPPTYPYDPNAYAGYMVRFVEMYNDNTYRADFCNNDGISFRSSTKLYNVYPMTPEELLHPEYVMNITTKWDEFGSPVNLNWYLGDRTSGREPDLTQMDPVEYVIRYADGRQYNFDKNGLLRFYDKNWRNNTPQKDPSQNYIPNHVDDYIEIKWTDDRKLQEVLAPPTDGRKLVFTYDSTHNVVTSVHLSHGAVTDSSLVDYEYYDNMLQDGDGYGNIKNVLYSDRTAYGVHYDYGAFNPADGTVKDWHEVNSAVTSPIAYLAKISEYQPSTGNMTPLVGYQYNSLDPHTLDNRIWVHDPAGSYWRMAMSNTGDFYLHHIGYMDGQKADGTGHYTGTSAIAYSNHKVNYARDPLQVDYTDIASMPITRATYHHTPDSVYDGQYPGTQYNSSRLATKVEQYVGSDATDPGHADESHWLPIKEIEYVDPDSGIDKVKKIKTYSNFTMASGGVPVIDNSTGAVQTVEYQYGTDNQDAFPSQITGSDGQRMLVTYNDAGQPTLITKQQYNNFTNVYDTLQTITVGYKQGGVATNGLVDHVAISGMGENKTATYTYDAQGNPLTVSDGTTQLAYTYDYYGNVLTITKKNLITSAEAILVTYTYSTSFLPPRLESIVDPATGTTTFTYDAHNRLWKIKNPANQETVITYDNQGNRKTVLTPGMNNPTEYTYDIYGRLTELKDPEGRKTVYKYDAFGRVLSEQPLDTNGNPLYMISYTYAGSGVSCGSCPSGGGSSTVASRTISSGGQSKTINFKYDLAGRLRGQGAGPLADDITYEYSGPRLTAINHGSALWGSGRLQYVYDDPYHRLTREIYPSGRSIDFAYDGLGRLCQVKDPFGFVNQMAYDADNRVYALDHEALGRVDLVYNTSNKYQVDQLKLGNGTSTSYQYDGNQRLTGYKHWLPSDTVNPWYATSWLFDELGRKSEAVPVTVNSTIPSVSGEFSFHYDPAGRLANESFFNQGSYVWKNTYGYDESGNRTYFNNDAVMPHTVYNMTYGTGNREATAPNSPLQYDFRGNVTVRPPLAGGGVYHYSWDDYDRLVSASRDGSSVSVAYTYDALGRLLHRTRTDGAQTQDATYYWLGLNKIAEETGPPEAVFRPDMRDAGVPGGVYCPPRDQGWSINYAAPGSTPVLEYISNGHGNRVLHINSGATAPLSVAALLGDTAADDSNAVGSPWRSTKRRLALWLCNQDSGHAPVHLTLLVRCQDGRELALNYSTDNVAQNANGSCFYPQIRYQQPVPNYNDGKWHYIEINLDEAIYTTGSAVTEVNGLQIRAKEVLVDDIILSNNTFRSVYQVAPGATLGGLIGAHQGYPSGSSPANLYFSYSELGTLVGITNKDGAVTWAGAADAYGNYRQQYGSRNELLGLTGKMHDVDAGLYYFGARWYDLERGHWMSEEPLGLDGPNLYQFLFQDPMNVYDFDGLHAVYVDNGKHISDWYRQGNEYGESGYPRIFIWTLYVGRNSWARYVMWSSGGGGGNPLQWPGIVIYEIYLHKCPEKMQKHLGDTGAADADRKPKFNWGDWVDYNHGWQDGNVAYMEEERLAHLHDGSIGPIYAQPMVSGNYGSRPSRPVY